MLLLAAGTLPSHEHSFGHLKLKERATRRQTSAPRVYLNSSGLERKLRDDEPVSQLTSINGTEMYQEASAATFDRAQPVSVSTRCRMSKTARVHKIEMLIRNRGHVSFQTLLDELEVSPATLKRDLDYLKDQLGAPIVYDRFLNGYKFGEEYRGQKYELPGLWFSERELYSLLMTHQLLSELDTERVISRRPQPLLDRIDQMLGPDEVDIIANWLGCPSQAKTGARGHEEVEDSTGHGCTPSANIRLKYEGILSKGLLRGTVHRLTECRTLDRNRVPALPRMRTALKQQQHAPQESQCLLSRHRDLPTSIRFGGIEPWI